MRRDTISMRESIKLFLKGVFCKFYVLLPTVLLAPFALYNNYFKSFLSPQYQIEIKIPSANIFLVLFVLFLWAAIKVYHELRIQRVDELYANLSEANKDRIFRIFYKLYIEGEFLKDADKSRRQKWDEEVYKEMTNYCTDAFKNNYLLDTGRRFGQFKPIADENYYKAVSIIKSRIDSDLYTSIK